MSDYQPNLFVGAPHNGVDTSIAAARSILPRLGTDEARVLACIRVNSGNTCDEVEKILGLRHQTASARINGLVAKGLLVRTSRKRKTRSGREAAVYEVRS